MFLIVFASFAYASDYTVVLTQYMVKAQYDTAVVMSYEDNRIYTTYSSYQDDSDGFGPVTRWLNLTGNTFGVEISLNENNVWFYDQLNPQVERFWYEPQSHYGTAFVWDSYEGFGEYNEFDIIVRPYNKSYKYLTSDECRINYYNNSNQTNPAIASDDNETMVVVWQGDQDGDFDIYAQKFNVSELMSCPDTTQYSSIKQVADTQINTNTTGNQRYPDVDMDKDENFVVVWESDSDDKIHIQKFNSSLEKEGTEQNVSSSSNKQFNPRIDMNLDGEFVVSWTEESSGQTDIYYQYYYPNVTVKKSKTLVDVGSCNQSKNQTISDVGIDADGNFIITYDDSKCDGDGWGVYAKKYGFDFGESADSFRVSDSTTYDQEDPAIDIYNLTEFVVTWTFDNRTTYVKDEGGIDSYKDTLATTFYKDDINMPLCADFDNDGVCDVSEPSGCFGENSTNIPTNSTCVGYYLNASGCHDTVNSAAGTFVNQTNCDLSDTICADYLPVNNTCDGSGGITFGTCGDYIAYNASGTLVNTTDCDYLDITCRNYHDVNNNCDGSGNISFGTCSSSYTDEPISTQCGSDYTLFSCYEGNDYDDDIYQSLIDQHCDGAGNCADYAGSWSVNTSCAMNEYCNGTSINSTNLSNYNCAYASGVNVDCAVTDTIVADSSFSDGTEVWDGVNDYCWNLSNNNIWVRTTVDTPFLGNHTAGVPAIVVAGYDDVKIQHMEFHNWDIGILLVNAHNITLDSLYFKDNNIAIKMINSSVNMLHDIEINNTNDGIGFWIENVTTDSVINPYGWMTNQYIDTLGPNYCYGSCSLYNYTMQYNITINADYPFIIRNLLNQSNVGSEFDGDYYVIENNVVGFNITNMVEGQIRDFIYNSTTSPLIIDSPSNDVAIRYNTFGGSDVQADYEKKYPMDNSWCPANTYVGGADGPHCNSPPYIQSQIANESLTEDGTSSINIDLWTKFNDNEESFAEMIYTIPSQNTSIINCSILTNRYLNCSDPVANAYGLVEVVVKAEDNDSWYNPGVNQTFYINVIPVNDAPIINSTAITNATENSAYSYDADATDIENDVLTFSLTTNPSGMSINSGSGLVSWTPNSSHIGNNSVTVQVNDGNGGIGNQTFNITVNNVNDAPIINSTAITNATEDILYAYDVDAFDVDVGDTLTYYLTISPAGMSINQSNGTITWTPTNSQCIGDQQHNVTVFVNDTSNASDTQSFTITAYNVNDAPVINSTPITTATENLTYSYDVDSYDADNDTLTFSLTTKPSGMSINSGTGLISWTPNSSHIGDNSVSVQADDGNTGTDNQTFNITVNNVNDAPIITSSAVTSATMDQAYSYDVNATDADGDNLTYSFTVKPSDMEIDSSTGLISWTPNASYLGNNSVSVKVDDGNGANDTQNFTITVSYDGFIDFDYARFTVHVNSTYVSDNGYDFVEDFLNKFEARYNYMENLTKWTHEKPCPGKKLEIYLRPTTGCYGGMVQDFGTYRKVTVSLHSPYDYSPCKSTYRENNISKFGNPGALGDYWSYMSTMLHETMHGIFPASVWASSWWNEGFATYLEHYVLEQFGDITNETTDYFIHVGTSFYNWDDYVANDYKDTSPSNATIQSSAGYSITAWMLLNLTTTYGHSMFESFYNLMDNNLEVLDWLDNTSSYIDSGRYRNDKLDTLMIYLFSMAADMNLTSTFRYDGPSGPGWGVRNFTSLDFLPDLSVTSLTFSNSTPNAFDEITAYITVNNSGIFNISTNVELYSNNTLKGSQNTTVLADGSVQLEFNFTETVNKTYLVTAWVDKSNLKAELNELNNNLTEIINFGEGCIDVDDDSICDSSDLCIGETALNIPSDTACGTYSFNSSNGCHIGNYNISGTVVNTTECDFWDHECRDYHDIDNRCDGSGNINFGYCNSSYTNRPDTTQCGIDHYRYSCYAGNNLGDDVYHVWIDQHCDGNGGCSDYEGTWEVNTSCLATEACVGSGVSSNSSEYYCSACTDSDSDLVCDSSDGCIGENQANLPSNTICSSYTFNSINGCHEASYLPPNTVVNQTDCDYLDTTCRDYDDVNNTCDGSGGINFGSCILYSDASTSTVCDSESCPADMCVGDDWYDYPASIDKYCDGSGSCESATCTASTSYSATCDSDDDDDGVADGSDLCSSTPSGETANSDGCSCSQQTIDDGNYCTDDMCTDGVISHVNNNNYATTITNCPADYCDGTTFYNYPDSGYGQCSSGVMGTYSCNLISSSYSSICAKPDLEISDLTIKPDNPSINTPVMLRFVILNSGTIAVNGVEWIIQTTDAQVAEQQNTFDLAVNEEMTVYAIIKYSATGNHALTIRADPQDSITESNETNNDYSTTVSIG